MRNVILLSFILFSQLLSNDLIGTQCPTFFSKNKNSLKKEFINVDEKINKGNGTVIVFFASWCKPCRTEIPFLQDIGTEHNTEILLVSVDDRWETDQIELLSELEIKVPVMHDKYKIISKQFGYTGQLPYTVYIDYLGIIREITTGFSEESKNHINSVVETLKK